MRLTRKSEYAVVALMHLARNQGQGRSLASEIAREAGIPQSFLAKIFQDLARAGLVRSHRGAGGGFSLARPASQITVREIVENAEGAITIQDCLDDSEFCDMDDSCALRAVWREARRRFLDVLESRTLEELVAPSGRAETGRSRL